MPALPLLQSAGDNNRISSPKRDAELDLLACIVCCRNNETTIGAECATLAVEDQRYASLASLKYTWLDRR
jgi:hypothetical protein